MSENIKDEIVITKEQAKILQNDEKRKFKLLFTSINENMTCFLSLIPSKPKQTIEDEENENKEKENEVHNSNDLEFHNIRVNAQFLPNLITINENEYYSSNQRVLVWKKETVPQIIAAAIQHIRLHYVIEEAIIERDTLKRTNWPLFKLTTNNIQEAEWQEIFLNNTKKYLPGFEYLWEFEWEPIPGRPDCGQNDLIMTDGYGIFAVVEVKLIYNDDAVDNKRIRKVTEQTRKYKDCFIKDNENNYNVLAVIGVSFTDQKDGTVRFLEEYDLLVAGAIANQLEYENYLSDYNNNNLIQNSAASTITAEIKEITQLDLIIARHKKEVQQLNGKIQKQAEQEKKLKGEHAEIQKKIQKFQKKEADRLQTELIDKMKAQQETDRLQAELIDKMKKIQDQTSLLEEAQQEIENMKAREIEYENALTIQQDINNKLMELMEKESELKVKMAIEQKEAEIKLRLEWERERQKEQRKEYYERIENLLHYKASYLLFSSINCKQYTQYLPLSSSLKMHHFKFLTIAAFMACFFGEKLEAIPVPDNSAATTDVTIYQHFFYGGISKDITLYSKVCTDVPPNFKKIFSSIKVQKGHCVKLYKELNCEGTPVSACEDTATLSPDYNDKIITMKADINILGTNL
ncbi:5345_t:CDS:2 [Ambispora gerdemannii]|uniref:5345_t:CDS:1 n=1 Tax=Ambispora gerdemannii TaxID=144530 RepID=A0A9N8WFC0_9GLOM|nr:5345_t:CDS:2 [Ambispora gerdemannii]